MGNKYSQKLLNSAKKFTADAIKTFSKRAIQKTAEATGDLIDNKIDRITKASKALHLEVVKSDEDIPKERYMSQEERPQIIDELRLV